MKKKRTPDRQLPPERSRDLLITQGMLYAVRAELRSEIRASSLGLKSEFTGLKSDFIGLRAEFTDLKSEFGKLFSVIEKMAATVANMDVKFYQCLAMMEDQYTRNIAVLDGYHSLYSRQERVESRLDGVEKTIANFRK